MKRQDFYYELPEELIAQDPLEDRSSSRLLVLDKETGAFSHHVFKEITEYLHEGDCLVINDTKVIPARLIGSKVETNAKIEVLLLKRKENNVWETLVKPGKKAKVGAKISFGDGLLMGEVIDVVEEGNRLIKFDFDGIFEEILDQLGQMPLPPYITHQLEDKNRYQTVYAKYEGSAAAPTAGLHFTPELLKKIEEKGIKIANVTLHVGIGTFRPVKEEKVENHEMHSEHYYIKKEDAEIIYSELKHWDGGISTHGQKSEHKFFTTSKDGADAVQYIGTILNFRSTILEDKRPNKYTDSFYTLTFTTQTNISLFPFQSKYDKKYIPELVKSEDGFKYCFTTSTGCFLARRNNKIFVTGNSDRIGFLPAGMTDKLEPHFASAKMILESLLSKGKVETELEKKIFFKVPNFCLGCTFTNSVVLIDEAQSLSPMILKLLLERIGENTKVIICGDSTQVYTKSNGRNGLTNAMERFFETSNGELDRDPVNKNLTPLFDNICYHRFGIEDVVRSEIVKSVLTAYSNKPL